MTDQLLREQLNRAYEIIDGKNAQIQQLSKDLGEATKVLRALDCQFGSGWSCDSVMRIEERLRAYKEFVGAKSLTGLFEKFKNERGLKF